MSVATESEGSMGTVNKMSLAFLLNERPRVGGSAPVVPSAPVQRLAGAGKGRHGDVGTESGSGNKSQGQRKKWTAEEDALLIELVENKGSKRWSDLAAHFPHRNSAQLRSRWAHRLADKEGNSMRPFTAEEDQWILQGHQRHGTKWRQIAREMDGRLAHDVQNRFWFLQRRSTAGAGDKQ
mmetsp:Transcript_864/g.2384  ORF Transcript_864/g.2384 Transcript_864/m.2384 type:complete len:180 (-) Transcript_864:90-629(-)